MKRDHDVLRVFPIETQAGFDVLQLYNVSHIQTGKRFFFLVSDILRIWEGASQGKNLPMQDKKKYSERNKKKLLRMQATRLCRLHH